jgi:hypothetical protein
MVTRRDAFAKWEIVSTCRHCCLSFVCSFFFLSWRIQLDRCIVFHWTILTSLGIDEILYYSRPLFWAYTGLIASLKINKLCSFYAGWIAISKKNLVCPFLNCRYLTYHAICEKPTACIIVIYMQRSPHHFIHVHVVPMNEQLVGLKHHNIEDIMKYVSYWWSQNIHFFQSTGAVSLRQEFIDVTNEFAFFTCASLIRSSASFSYVTSIVSNIFKITVDVHSRWCSKWWSVTLCTAPWFICGLERHSKRISTLLPFILLSLFSFFIMTNSTQSSLFFIGTIPTSLSIDVLLYYSRPLFCAYTGLIASLKITYCVHSMRVGLRFGKWLTVLILWIIDSLRIIPFMGKPRV